MDYSSMTYEVILQRMLNRIPDNMDKREGSIIYDALAPAARELADLYAEFGEIETESYADTASREYLIKRAAERGITPHPATNAIVKGVFTPTDIEIPIGTRFNSDNLNYIVISKIQGGQYQLQCETGGTVGNGFSTTLIPIDYVDGLETAQISEVLIPGEDEEDTEMLRSRYFESFDTKAFGGNKTDYVQKTNEIDGVGSTKVTPVWNGGGTVKLTILNSDFGKASNTLIETVQNIIDPEQDGNGIGIAPIGHIVTVDTAEEVLIYVKATLTFASGYTFNSLKSQIEDVIKEYLLEIRKEWANNVESLVRIRQIELKILGIEGIIDIVNTKINNSTNNLALSKYQIPIFGGVSQ